MNSSRINIISVLYRSGKTVFRLKDIALLTSETNFQSLNKKIKEILPIYNSQILNKKIEKLFKPKFQ
jgi:hypothetical protein